MTKIKRTEIFHDIIMHIIHSFDHSITVTHHVMMDILDWPIVESHHLTDALSTTVIWAATISWNGCLPIVISVVLLSATSFIWC